MNEQNYLQWIDCNGLIAADLKAQAAKIRSQDNELKQLREVIVSHAQLEDRISELTTSVATITQERDKAIEELADFRARFDPEMKVDAAKERERLKAAKARELERLKAQAAQLEKELATIEAQKREEAANPEPA